MNSAIMIMFALATISCFDISDAVDGYTSFEMERLKALTEQRIQAFQNYFVEKTATMRDDLSEMKDKQHQLFHKIIDSANASILEHAKTVKATGKNVDDGCQITANDEFNNMSTAKIDGCIDSEIENSYYLSSDIFYTKAQSFIERLDAILDGRTIFTDVEDAKSEFETILETFEPEKSIIDKDCEDALKKTTSCAEEFEKKLRETAARIENNSKSCIDRS